MSSNIEDDIKLGCRILIYVGSIALAVVIIMMINNGQQLIELTANYLMF